MLPLAANGPRRLTVVDGRAVLDGAGAGPGYEIEAINLDLVAAGAAGPYALSGGFTLAAQPFDFTAQLGQLAPEAWSTLQLEVTARDGERPGPPELSRARSGRDPAAPRLRGDLALSRRRRPRGPARPRPRARPAVAVAAGLARGELPARRPSRVRRADRAARRAAAGARRGRGRGRAAAGARRAADDQPPARRPAPERAGRRPAGWRGPRAARGARRGRSRARSTCRSASSPGAAARFSGCAPRSRWTASAG